MDNYNLTLEKIYYIVSLFTKILFSSQLRKMKLESLLCMKCKPLGSYENLGDPVPDWVCSSMRHSGNCFLPNWWAVFRLQGGFQKMHSLEGAMSNIMTLLKYI